jgi:hypothetical protein
MEGIIVSLRAFRITATEEDICVLLAKCRIKSSSGLKTRPTLTPKTYFLRKLLRQKITYLRQFTLLYTPVIKRTRYKALPAPKPVLAIEATRPDQSS